jgi:hypothetical protein
MRARRYDYDVDPAKRKETPNFYGYIPIGLPRTIIFVCLTLNSSLLLLMRSFSVSLLLLKGTRYFVWFQALDFSFFLLYKLARMDFLHWFPFDGVLSVSTSLAMRVINKTIVDFTGSVQARASGELGGFYWLLDMFLTLLAPYAVIEFYFSSTSTEDVWLDESTVRSILPLLTGSWVLIFFVFMLSMNPEYRSTFYSLESGNEWAMSFFLRGDTDAKRVKPLRLNKAKWKKIRPEMKEFVLSKWETWEEEQPDFFSHAFKKRVDDDMIPPEELRKLLAAEGGKRRRSSVGEMLGGSVGLKAESRRRSSSVAPTPAPLFGH